MIDLVKKEHLDYPPAPANVSEIYCYKQCPDKEFTCIGKQQPVLYKMLLL